MHLLTIALVGLASALLASDANLARRASRAYGVTPPGCVIAAMRGMAGLIALLSAGLLLMALVTGV